MKKEFSKNWESSKQPRKQRKYLANAPLHIKKRFLASNLAKELRKKYSLRSLTVRKNDVVKVLSGKFKKKSGKVVKVDYKKMRVEIEGLQVKKQDGSKSNVKFPPSNLQIIELNLDDKKRLPKQVGHEKENKKVPLKEVEEKNAS